MPVAPVQVFAALGDPTRQRLLALLASRDRAPAGQLAAELTLTRQAVEKQLHILRDAGLVSGVRAGRRVGWTVRTDSLVASATWLQDVAADWDRQLGLVKAAAETPSRPQS